MSFELLAPHYTWMEAVLAGRRLQRSRVAWLDALARCDDILVAGVGHGHFMASCARRFPRARITGVDASAGMLAQAERRTRRAVGRTGQLEFVHATLPGWSPAAGEFDAIVTHFFLDCFPPDELREVIGGLARSARPAARWLVTDFAVPSRGWGRQRARLVHALMYGFFRRLTKIRARRVTEPDPMLVRHGFALAGRKTAEWGLLRSDLWIRAPGRPTQQPT